MRDRVSTSWEKYSLWPLLSLGVIFLFAYALPVISPDAPADLLDTCDVATRVIWVLFIADYVFRFALSNDRKRFFKSNLIDLLAIALPALRPLRALRIISVLLIATRRLGHNVRHRVTLYVASLAVFTWFMAGLAITDAERGAPGANIENVVNGWYWAFTTLAAGGSGPYFPVTDQGMLIQVVVVLAALALVGTLSAIIVSWFVDESGKSSESLKEIESLRGELSTLSKKLDEILRRSSKPD
jgi:voltage-gated potassium channel